jgi:hypothetical protein
MEYGDPALFGAIGVAVGAIVGGFVQRSQSSAA